MDERQRSTDFQTVRICWNRQNDAGKHIAENVNGLVEFAAYTGKAADVLRNKGCHGAQTIHKLIYIPEGSSYPPEYYELSDEFQILASKLDADERDSKRMTQINIRLTELEKEKKLKFQINEESVAQHAKLVIIDECSMVGEDIGKDLLEIADKVLVLGDPAQLPPVKSGGFFTNHEPDFMLTDIHRQAKESPIIELATKVRNKEILQIGTYGNCSVLGPGERYTDIALEADQIICGTHKMRHASNKKIREYRGYDSEIPVATEKVICLYNDYDKGFFNGQIWTLEEDAVRHGLRVKAKAKCDGDGQKTELAMGTPKDTPFGYEVASDFDYSYCLTCHKSQGSQWDHVMVIDESKVFRQDAWRWLYTAITRAAERVDIIQK